MKKVSVGQTFSGETDRPIRTDFEHCDVLRKIGKEREETSSINLNTRVSPSYSLIVSLDNHVV